MFQKITSENYFDEINVVQCRYYVDENLVYWYQYDDICYLAGMRKEKADKLIKEIEEYNKCKFDDSNNYNKFGLQYPKVEYFITSEAMRELFRRENERNIQIVKSFNNLECRIDAHYEYGEDEEIFERIKMLMGSVNEKDYEEIFYQAHMLNKTKTSRDVLDKLKVIDKEKEEVIDKVREQLYSQEEINCIIMEDDDKELFKIFKENDIWVNWIWNENPEDK